jgi:hypothetical protein
MAVGPVGVSSVFSRRGPLLTLTLTLTLADLMGLQRQLWILCTVAG